MSRRKQDYLKLQIIEAEKAVERYSKGELTVLEKHIGCDANKLQSSWSDTLNRLRGDFKM